MSSQTIRNIHSLVMLILDALMVGMAFVIAYFLRLAVPLPNPLINPQPFANYIGLLIAEVGAVIFVLISNRMYYIPRSVSRIDQFYNVFASSSIGTIIAIAISTMLFKNNEFEVDYPRVMVIYSWLLSILFIMIGRTLYQTLRESLLARYGWGKDRILLVGTGEMARIILQRILWTPNLGYEVVGIVNNFESDESAVLDLFNVPLVGEPEQLPELIEKYQIDEVIVAIPEKGQREIVRIVSYCERGRVSIKVFPDILQFVTSQATIDDLGGLPLLTVRDFALRGYMLVFKRLMDVAGALFGIIVLSPIMMLVAVAIKLESPGSAFFVQERMGLDGKPFPMIKFRSMRSDAERDGPGWTTDGDPRQTKFGTLLRKIDVDEIPQLINVLLGEMSLVGPRPEQPYYVELFRESVPRYMERHREKAGMTGWAQVNGLRGDTSIVERTKYDIWYSENWSILLDIKIIIRTVWQIVVGRNGGN